MFPLHPSRRFHELLAGFEPKAARPGPDLDEVHVTQVALTQAVTEGARNVCLVPRNRRPAPLVRALRVEHEIALGGLQRFGNPLGRRHPLPEENLPRQVGSVVPHAARVVDHDGDPSGGLGAHERSAALPAADESLLLQDPQRAAHGDARNLVALRELDLRGKPAAVSVLATDDAVPQIGGNPAVHLDPRRADLHAAPLHCRYNTGTDNTFSPDSRQRTAGAHQACLSKETRALGSRHRPTICGSAHRCLQLWIGPYDRGGGTS